MFTLSADACVSLRTHAYPHRHVHLHATRPPSNRHHRRNQVCSVQYCVQQLCTVQCTHTWTHLRVVCWMDLAFWFTAKWPLFS